jgi:glycosyltransferase involved in cell wall biosynthesis
MVDKEPRLSVIIPCYNYALFLPDALKSLQQQVFTNWECWVVDDGSTDTTAAIAQQVAALDDRIHYIYQVNQGQPSARNAGLLQARGEYIQFLDADDLLEPMKLVVQLTYLDKHAETDIVYGDVRYFKNSSPAILFINRWGTQTEEWMPKVSGKGLPLVRALVQQNIFELGCALFRKSAIDAIGLFDQQLQGVEDYDYSFRAAALGLSFVYLDKNDTRCLMRHHAESFSKGLFLMYKKELMLRRGMKRKLKETGNEELLSLNKNNYAWRLKRLQHLLIDDTIKRRKTHVNMREIKWVLYNSSLKQNLYFFPRFIKALVTHP